MKVLKAAESIRRRVRRGTKDAVSDLYDLSAVRFLMEGGDGGEPDDGSEGVTHHAAYATVYATREEFPVGSGDGLTDEELEAKICVFIATRHPRAD